MSKIGRNDLCPCGSGKTYKRCGLHQHEAAAAERAARDLLDRYPDVHDGFERLAMVYEARGDRGQAAEYFRKALAFMEASADGYDAEAIDWMRAKAESLEHTP